MVEDHGLDAEPGPWARLRHQADLKPPDRQEPQFASVQAAGEQFIGLTGDGRIHTWTQDHTPKQVPSPAQTSVGFHYLQAAAGSQWQAGLGSDQRIYTWTRQQPAPIILDTVSNSQFTSISTNDDRLLAVDRQGRIHAFQTGLTGNQDLNPKPAEQATTDLPGQAQAVTAVASDSRILALDTDGQAWTWETSNTGKAKPERTRQDTKIRIIQAQSIKKGFLLLDADGQAHYLANNTTSLTAVGLPEDMRASRISANGSQAIITGTNGQVWAWQPGKAPMRADNGNQHYMQAAEADSRIMALDRQGSMFTWSLDHQSNPGKTSRVDTSTTPTLESASLDGQPLKLSEKNESWQVDIPVRKPGPAAITLAGRQDGRPFTRSLNYTVDQPLTRDTETETGHTVHFNTDGGSPEPEDQTVPNPYGRVQRPSPNPERKGYQFDGWFIGEVAYDFSKPVTKGLTLTAHWTPTKQNNQWSISPDKGSQLGKETITITPPTNTSRGIRFSQASGGGYLFADQTGYSLAVGSDGNAYAWGNNKFGQLGIGTTARQNTPVPVPKPADAPTDFTYVQVVAGGYHSLAIGSDGYVYAWGLNDHGQLGNNTTSISSLPVRVHGPNNSGEGLKAIQVTGGAWNSMALGVDGTVYTWGSISKGYDRNGSSQQTFPAAVKDSSDASGVFHAVQISTGWSFDMAIGQDGYVYVWGYNTNGQFGNNTNNGTSANIFNPTPGRVFASSKSTAAAGPWLKAVQVSAGYWYALAIDTDGNTWAWGQNTYGSLGNGTSNGEYDANPVPVRVKYPVTAGPVTAKQVNAGGYYALAIDTDGNTWAWGRNDFGQLGDNTTSNRYTPVKVFASAQSTSSAGPWMNTVQISARWQHSLAIGTNGYAKAWGDNQYGQLGNPNAGSRSLAPVLVAFNLQPVITSVTFDTSPGTNLIRGDGSSASVTTPAHLPGTVTVSVKYTLGGAGNTQTDTSLRYTYLPAAPTVVLPSTGGAGILLTLVTGVVSMGSVVASRHHKKKRHQLSQT